MTSLKRERFSWCLFDFANSAFNTIVLTFVYAAFFKKGLVIDEARADVLWARALAIIGLSVALLSPVIGVIADRTGNKKRFLVIFASMVVVATALLFFPAPSGGRASDGVIYSALALVIIASISFELMFVFYNAFLPGLGDASTVGRLSGKGWALGYLGGLLCLVVCLGFVGKGFGPWLPADDGLNIRATNLVVAAWLLLFGLPMFLWVKDRSSPPKQSVAAPWSGAVRQVLRTIRSLRRYPDLLRLLVARLFFNDALVAIMALSALYMVETIKMSGEDIILTGIWLNVVAGLGAYAFGHVDDRIGAKTTLVWSLFFLIGGVALAMARPDRTSFLIAATLIGLGMGPNQSSSRTLMVRFIVPQRSGEFFGLFELSGKASIWISPLLFSLIRDFGGSQRQAMIPLLVMFGIGLFVVLFIDEKRGSQEMVSSPEST